MSARDTAREQKEEAKKDENDTETAEKTEDEPISDRSIRRRKKVPLQPGFSALDWAKLSASGRDLTGTGGRVFPIPMSEVKKHNSREDAWTVVRGKVYVISPYLNFHPGGVDMLMKGAGRDATALFEKYHRWVSPEVLLRPCLIGVLVPESD
mmetsp:Transcript_4040/g.12308  ORF Transcript_4040/g.12308 Transcript_4040/m.12308 type:complete len:152 (+) Transcript_4040:88-543(+)